MEAANLPTFLKFGNATNQIPYLCYLCKKNHGWPRNWKKTWSKTGGCTPTFPLCSIQFGFTVLVVVLKFVDLGQFISVYAKIEYVRKT